MAKTAEILEVSATITDRGQTTVPAAIRRMLSLKKRDRVVFKGLADGTVIIAREPEAAPAADPVLDRFLDFLATDMSSGPDRIRPIRADVAARAAALVEGIEVDLDEPLPDDDA